MMNAGDKTGWPPLPYVEWVETCNTLHLWPQIVGKYRLAHTLTLLKNTKRSARHELESMP